MWGCDLDLNVHLVLELCDDLSSLGTKLMAEAAQLGTSRLKAYKEGIICLNELAWLENFLQNLIFQIRLHGWSFQ
jgi:hypothetical protein